MKNKSPKIVISGYYGFDNCGDEAVLAAMLHCLKSLYPDLRVVVCSNNPDKTREASGAEAINRWNLIRVALEILTCRLLISGGGSLLQDVTSSKSLSYYLGVIRIALALRKKVMIYSQGIGPLSNKKNRMRTQRVLDRCSAITVRDIRSADFLMELGLRKDIHVACDPVMAFSRDDIDTDEINGLLVESGVIGSKSDEHKSLLMVAVRSWKADSHIAPIAELLDIQIMSGWDVLLVPAHYPDDMKAIDKLRDLMSMQPYMIGRELTAYRFLALAARADKVLSMRLHGLICAAAMETPILGISYDPKIDAFMEQAGLERYCLPYDNIDLNMAKALLEELDALPSDYTRVQKARRTEMQESAWEPARKAVELLQK